MTITVLIIAVGLAASLVPGAHSASCPSGTVSLNLTSFNDVQDLTDALNCTGKGVYEIIWNGRLRIEEPIEVSDNKHVTVNGSTGTSRIGTNDDDDVIDAGNATSIFLVTNGSTLSINHLMLVRGYSGVGGAVALNSSSSLHVNGCGFTNNGASTGGAISANDSELYIDGSTNFSYNSADFGGAISVNGSELYIDGSTYLGYNSADFGGAVYAHNSTIDINGDARFTNNSAAKYGGAAYTVGSIFGINSGSRFVRNSALSGGGIYSGNGLSSKLHLSGETTFAGNVAENDGGAIYIGSLDQVGIADVAFASNTAQQGGAIYVASSSSGIFRKYENCKFDDNIANNGGAIYFSGGDNGFDSVHRSTFQGNDASTSGGGIYLLKGHLEVNSSDFMYNKAGEEGMAIASVSFLTPVNLSDVLFLGNSLYCPLGQYGSHENVSISSAFLMVCEGCSTATDEVPDNVVVNQYTPVCKELPTGTVAQSEGTTLQSITLAAGYYRIGLWSEVLLECPRFEACSGGSNPQDYCTVGYELVYCATCSDGYSAGIDNSCRVCSEADVRAATAMASAVALAFLLAVAVILRYLGKVVDDDGQNQSHGMIREVVSRFQDILIKAHPPPAIKIVVVVWQIVFQFGAIAKDVYPEEYQEFLSFLSFVNFDIIYITSYSCLFYPGFYGRLLIVTIAPVMVLTTLAVSYYIATGNYDSTTQHLLRTSRNRHLAAALFVVFFVYSSVSSTIFQTFRCEDVGGVSYLKADYSIECNNVWYERYKIFAAFMVIVFPIGIPAFVGWWIYRNRKSLNASNRQTIAYLKPFSSIWGTYKPSRYYYEVVEYCRRLTLSMSSVFLVPNSVNQIAVVLSLAAVFMFVSESISPFDRSVDMSLYRWGNIIILASMYIALLKKANESDDELGAESLFGWLLIAANVMMVVAVLAQALLFSPDCGDQPTTVEQIIPPVRRQPLATSENGRPRRTTPVLKVVRM